MVTINFGESNNMRHHNFKKYLLMLCFPLLMNVCTAMEQQLQSNPEDDFATNCGGDHGPAEQYATQAELSEEILFYKEKANGKKECLIRYVPSVVQQEGKAQQIINIKKLIDEPTIKEFIINAYQTDKDVIAALVDRVLLVEKADAQGRVKVSSYDLNSTTDYHHSFEGKRTVIRPALFLDALLLHPHIRSYAEELYKMPRVQKKKPFYKKHPKISLAIISLYGAFCMGTLWHFTSLPSFIESSFSVKTFKLAAVVLGCSMIVRGLIKLKC